MQNCYGFELVKQRCKRVHGCGVVHTKRAPRGQQFHVAPVI